MNAVARILALLGPRRGVVRELDGLLVVGRGAEAGLQLLDEKVSREHCALDVLGEGHGVTDLGSRNGTWLNGARLEGPPVPLRPGDHVGIGETLLVYEPSFEALTTRDGESTVVLTRSPADRARPAAAPSGLALEKAGELALRAATAKDPSAAAALLAQAVQGALTPKSLAILVGAAAPRPLLALPAGTNLSVGRPLLELAFRQGRALAGPERQGRGETDERTTRLRLTDGEVLCAPFFVAGVAAGALCVSREKPFTDEEITLAGALAAAVGGALSPPLSQQPLSRFELPVAESGAMREAMRIVAAAAQVSSTVLVTGDSGTGKEEIARAIHALGPRSSGPFVAINCGAIPSELAEAELFGHEKGAFTGALGSRPGVFERADGGTLFLDEVGDLPLAMQVKLLRAIQERVVTRVGGRAPLTFDARIVSATHRDLAERVKQGEFRDDLFWRLNVLRIHLPPLRERPEDILPLAERLLARSAPELRRRADGFTAEARKALEACPWPGNARQLGNALERALVLKEAPGPITLSELPPEVVAPEKPRAGSGAGRTLGELVQALEREQIVLALKRARGVKVAAAEALGISRPTLDRKIEEYEIDLFS